VAVSSAFAFCAAVNFVSLLSMLLYFFSNCGLTVLCMLSWISSQLLPHSDAACRCIFYKDWFRRSFFLYKYLISSLNRVSCAFFYVTFAAGEVQGIFIRAYFGIISRLMYWRLKYILTQHFRTLTLSFLYWLMHLA